MSPLRERIFPDVYLDIEDDEMIISTVVRKQHTDGIYYLTEVKRTAVEKDQMRKVSAIHRMINDFNYMVFMFLMFSPVDPKAVNIVGARIFIPDPDQTDELERVYRVCDEEEAY